MNITLCPQKFLSLNLVNLFHIACLILSFCWLMIVVSIRKIITKGFQMISYENVSLSLTSDFLQDLVCMCKGKSICSRNCVCVEQNLSCTSICGC